MYIFLKDQSCNMWWNSAKCARYGCTLVQFSVTPRRQRPGTRQSDPLTYGSLELCLPPASSPPVNEQLKGHRSSDWVNSRGRITTARPGRRRRRRVYTSTSDSSVWSDLITGVVWANTRLGWQEHNITSSLPHSRLLLGIPKIKKKTRVH